MTDQPCTCSTCSEIIHVYYDKSSTVKPLKLLEQAHCGHCWRPLRVASTWPGPRRGQSQPYGNGRSIVVAQCGHLYHGNCAGKATHCALCFSTLEKLVPLHYQERSSRQDCQAKSQLTSKVDPRKDVSPESKATPEGKEVSGVGKNLEELISTLRDKIEHISEEVISLRRQLTRRPPPANRWRWTVDRFDSKNKIKIDMSKLFNVYRE